MPGGGLAWEEAAAEVASRLDSHFRGRLRWAAAVQNLVFTRPGKALLHLLVTRFERVLPLLFERTR